MPAAAIDCSSYSCSRERKKSACAADGTRVLIWNSTYNAQPDAFLAQLLAPTLRLSSKHTSFPRAALFPPRIIIAHKYTRKTQKGCAGKPHFRRPGEKKCDLCIDSFPAPLERCVIYWLKMRFLTAFEWLTASLFCLHVYMRVHTQRGQFLFPCIRETQKNRPALPFRFERAARGWK